MLACAKTTTVLETLTTFKFKCYFFRTGNFVFKAPLLFDLIWTWYCLAHGFFYQRS